MTNERKIEILEEVRNRIITGNCDTVFICNVTNEVISGNEYNEYMKWFKTKRPSETQYQKFTKSKFWYGNIAWWDESAKSQRIKFLTVLINELHDKSKKN